MTMTMAAVRPHPFDMWYSAYRIRNKALSHYILMQVLFIIYGLDAGHTTVFSGLGNNGIMSLSLLELLLCAVSVLLSACHTISCDSSTRIHLLHSLFLHPTHSALNAH